MHVSALGADEIIGELHVKNRTKRTVEVRPLPGKGFTAAKEALQNFTVYFETGWCWCAK